MLRQSTDRWIGNLVRRCRALRAISDCGLRILSKLHNERQFPRFKLGRRLVVPLCGSCVLGRHGRQPNGEVLIGSSGLMVLPNGEQIPIDGDVYNLAWQPTSGRFTRKMSHHPILRGNLREIRSSSGEGYMRFISPHSPTSCSSRLEVLGAILQREGRGKPQMKTTLKALWILVVFALVAAACGGDDDSADETTAAPTETTAATTAAPTETTAATTTAGTESRLRRHVHRRRRL